MSETPRHLLEGETSSQTVARLINSDRVTISSTDRGDWVATAYVRGDPHSRVCSKVSIGGETIEDAVLRLARSEGL